MNPEPKIAQQGLALLTAVGLVVGWASACGDDGVPATTPVADASLADTGQDDPDVAPEPDASEPDARMDVAEDVAAPDVSPDVEGDVEADAPEAPGLACDDAAECVAMPNTLCIEGACTLNPESRVYVEDRYDLQEPEELAPVISTIKGLIGRSGLFMTRLSALDADDAMRVTYGGGDLVERVDDGLDLYAWQVPEANLPTFSIHRYASEAQPLAYNTWESDVFDYRLVAVVTVGETQVGLGFEASDSTVRFRFNDDLSEVTTGRLEGFITRKEAELRAIDIQDCLLSMGICPGFDCDNDPPIATVADILDCRGARMDADIDPLVDGDDAYRAVILFHSLEVELTDQ